MSKLIAIAAACIGFGAGGAFVGIAASVPDAGASSASNNVAVVQQLRALNGQMRTLNRNVGSIYQDGTGLRDLHLMAQQVGFALRGYTISDDLSKQLTAVCLGLRTFC